MAENNALTGLQPLGNHFGRPASRQPSPDADGAGGGRRAPADRPRADSVELAPVAATALALLEQCVLRATGALVPGAGHPLGAIVRVAAATGAPAAVAQVHSAQLWYLGAASADPAVLRQAFVRGLDEAQTILAEISHGDTAIANWLQAVRALVVEPGRGSGA